MAEVPSSANKQLAKETTQRAIRRADALVKEAVAEATEAFPGANEHRIMAEVPSSANKQLAKETTQRAIQRAEAAVKKAAAETAEASVWATLGFTEMKQVLREAGVPHQAVASAKSRQMLILLGQKHGLTGPAPPRPPIPAPSSSSVAGEITARRLERMKARESAGGGDASASWQSNFSSLPSSFVLKNPGERTVQLAFKTNADAVVEAADATKGAVRVRDEIAAERAAARREAPERAAMLERELIRIRERVVVETAAKKAALAQKWAETSAWEGRGEDGPNLITFDAKAAEKTAAKREAMRLVAAEKAAAERAVAEKATSEQAAAEEAAAEERAAAEQKMRASLYTDEDVEEVEMKLDRRSKAEEQGFVRQSKWIGLWTKPPGERLAKPGEDLVSAVARRWKKKANINLYVDDEEVENPTQTRASRKERLSEQGFSRQSRRQLG